MKLRFVAAAAVLAIAPALLSQEFRGTIGGDITDATGSFIARAKVTVTEAHTGAKVELVSRMFQLVGRFVF